MAAPEHTAVREPSHNMQSIHACGSASSRVYVRRSNCIYSSVLFAPSTLPFPLPSRSFSCAPKRDHGMFSVCCCCVSTGFYRHHSHPGILHTLMPLYHSRCAHCSRRCASQSGVAFPTFFTGTTTLSRTRVRSLLSRTNSLSSPPPTPPLTLTRYSWPSSDSAACPF